MGLGHAEHEAVASVAATLFGLRVFCGKVNVTIFFRCVGGGIESLPSLLGESYCGEVNVFVIFQMNGKCYLEGYGDTA